MEFSYANFAMIYYHQMPINRNFFFDSKQSRYKHTSALQRAIHKVENQAIEIILRIPPFFCASNVKITEYHFHHDKYSESEF